MTPAEARQRAALVVLARFPEIEASVRQIACLDALNGIPPAQATEDAALLLAEVNLIAQWLRLRASGEPKAKAGAK